jgi:hypothetical protein
MFPLRREQKHSGGHGLFMGSHARPPGLHKRGTSAEDWGGSHKGRAARSYTGARGDSHPLTFKKASAPSGICFKADRLPYQRAKVGR